MSTIFYKVYIFFKTTTSFFKSSIFIINQKNEIMDNFYLSHLTIWFEKSSHSSKKCTVVSFFLWLPTPDDYLIRNKNLVLINISDLFNFLMSTFYDVSRSAELDDILEEESDDENSSPSPPVISSPSSNSPDGSFRLRNVNRRPPPNAESSSSASSTDGRVGTPPSKGKVTKTVTSATHQNTKNQDSGMQNNNEIMPNQI